MVITEAHDEQFKNHEKRHHQFYIAIVLILGFVGIFELLTPFRLLYGPDSIPLVSELNRYWINSWDIFIVIGWNWQYFTTTKLLK